MRKFIISFFLLSSTMIFYGQSGVFFGSNVQIGSPSPTVILARSVPGIDCTGTNDSSAALNAILSTKDALTNKTLDLSGCKVRADSMLYIYGQENPTITMGGNLTTGNPFSTQGPGMIFGCNGTAGPLLKIDRSGYVNFNGGSLILRGTSCPSNFTEGIQTVNSSAGGYTTTQFHLHDILIAPSAIGQTTSAFTGVDISGGPNQEEFHFDNVQVSCGNIVGSIGFLQNSSTADSTLIENSTAASCNWNFDNEGGAMTLRHVQATGASYATYGAGASILKGPMFVDGITCGDGSGTLLRPTASGNGGGVLNNIGCAANPGAVDPAAYFIDPGYGRDLELHGLNFFGTGAPTLLNQTLIGQAAAPGGVEAGKFKDDSLIWDMPTGIALTNGIWQSTKFNPVTIFSHAGTQLYACGSTTVASKQWVSDATALTPGTAYDPTAGAGNKTTEVGCTFDGTSSYAWQTM